MKKTIILFPLVFLLAGFTINLFIDGKIQEVLNKLQLTDSSAKEFFFNDCSGPSFYVPNLKSLKNISTGDRSSFVQIIGDYVKQYTTSKEFIDKYNQYRESKKPNEPEKPKSVAELKKEQKESIGNSIKEMENAKSQASSDQKAMYDDMIKTMKQQLADIDDPEKSMYTPEMDKMFQDSYKQQMENYNQEVKEWEKTYPVDNPHGMLKVWLNKFLEMSNDVDFSAKTAIDTDGRSKFVKQEYERKDNNWKLCYRAGQETVYASRKFAQDWLKELK